MPQPVPGSARIDPCAGRPPGIVLGVQCPLCQTSYLPGTLFCDDCGGTLVGAPARAPASGARALPALAHAAPRLPPRLRVLVLNVSHLTGWLEDPVIEIGRADPDHHIAPTVDLHSLGGQAAGVSRRHARILRQPDGYYLEDLGSINGTFINHHRLRPGQPIALRDRDEIRLGNIVIRAIFGNTAYLG